VSKPGRREAQQMTRAGNRYAGSGSMDIDGSRPPFIMELWQKDSLLALFVSNLI
jgi:hypothetical protein